MAQEQRARRLERAAFLVSIDTEMAWGTVHRGGGAVYAFDKERNYIDRLLQLLHVHGISATWAIVGHLFLPGCTSIEGVKHPEIKRPTYSWLSRDWFDPDPCGDAEHDPTWYAPDLIERITACPTPQEIASHSFSHLIVGDPGCSPEAFDSDLKECRRLADRVGVPLKSFVFPRNMIGHLPVLQANGFSAYRGRPRHPFEKMRDPLRSLLSAADRLWPGARSVVYPEVSAGMWNLPGTCMFDVSDRRWSYRLWVRQMSRRLRQAARHGAIFHVWFHPHNLAACPERSFFALDRLLGEARALREAAMLDTVTMGGLADLLEVPLSTR